MNLKRPADQENIVLEQLLTQSAIWWEQDVNGDNCLKPWKTVYSCNSRLKKSGIWQEIHDFLVKKVREIIGKNETPSVGIIDSQSVKTTQKGDSELARK